MAHEGYICILYLYCGYLSLFEVFLCCPLNESKNLLVSGRIFNFLNNYLQEALLLVPAIILMIFF
jgi:hypothetical protein